MDSKSHPSSSYDYQEEEAPPSYCEKAPPSTSTTTYPTPSTSSTSQYYSTQITTQLQSITSTITSLQNQKLLLSHAQDEKILSLLTHQIQHYLTSFSQSGLRKGTLILIPKAGLEDENALPAQYDFCDPEEYDRVVRVGGKDGEGEEGGWFWRDEDMAKRLVGYLRPKTAPSLPSRKEVVKAPAESSSMSSSSRGFWGRKNSVKNEDKPPLIEERKSEKEPAKEMGNGEGNGDRVLMEVKAEEVVFRTENDFGIWESRRGWGIVLMLRLVMGNR